MWPKLLFELLPHFSRLLPVADKYLATRGASDQAQAAALAELDASLRGELAKAAEAQDGLRRQLQEQSTQIAEMSVDVSRARMGVESIEARLTKLEKQLAQIRGLVAGAAVLAAIALAILIARKG